MARCAAGEMRTEPRDLFQVLIMILEPSSSKAALDSSSVTRVASVDSPPAYSQPSELSETASESLRSEFKNVQQKRRGRRKRVALIALAIVFYSIALVVFVVQVCSSLICSST